jgi:hypothetical protein
MGIFLGQKIGRWKNIFLKVFHPKPISFDVFSVEKIDQLT